MSLYPLPNLIELSDFNGDWNLYKQHLYDIFQDEILGKISFLGLPVNCRRHEEIDGLYRTFWHLITESTNQNQKDEDRLVDMRRCERIGWIPHILKNINNPEIKCWRNKRGKESNIVIWLEKENYMIILSNRSKYYLLLTAYTNDHITQKRNLSEIKKYTDPRNS